MYSRLQFITTTLEGTVTLLLLTHTRTYGFCSYMYAYLYVMRFHNCITFVFLINSDVLSV